MTTADCVKEQSTQHYLGPGNGHGKVEPHEQVIFAVFETMDRDGTGTRLQATAFSSKQLKRHEFSLGRLSYLTKSELQKQIVAPQTSTRGPLVGIARAEVKALRDLNFSLEGITCRAVCVTDKVTKLDFDAHAVLGYSESQDGLKPKKKESIRAVIQANLAETFGDLISIDAVFAA